MAIKKSYVFHTIHVVCLIGFIIFYEACVFFINHSKFPKLFCNTIKEQGLVYGIFYYSFRAIILLSLPQTIFNIVGLVFYNTFADLDRYPVLQDIGNRKICIQLVTRGDYPDLVNFTLLESVRACDKVYKNCFLFELLTEKLFDLKTELKDRVKVTLVPRDYKTKTGILYRARNLQYALELNNSQLKDDDYVVHIDEETILTESVARGLVKFCAEGKFEFGHGLLNLSNNTNFNFLLFMADCIQVSENLGQIRAAFNLFHRPLYSWRGAFCVCQYGAEKAVSYDHGPQSQTVEDSYFALLADQMRFKFGYVSGVMHEQCCASFRELFTQRRRWLHGLCQVTLRAHELKLRRKFFFTLRVLVWMSLPLSFVNNFLLSCDTITNAAGTFLFAVYGYMYIFGCVKSLQTSRIDRSKVKCVGIVILSALLVPITILIESSCVLYMLFTPAPVYKVTKKVAYHLAKP